MKIKGQDITRVWTQSSRFDNNSVALCDDKGNQYRMKAEEILRLLDGRRFIPIKKRTHTYLELVDDGF